MSRFLPAACVALALALFGAHAKAAPLGSTTVTFSGGSLENNSSGTFKQYKQGGFGIYHRYTNHFVYSNGALYGGYQAAQLADQTPSSNWNSAVVYVGRIGYSDLVLDGFDIDYFGDKITWTIYGYSSSPGTPLGTPLASGTYGGGSTPKGWTTIDLAGDDLPYEYQYAIELQILSTDSGKDAKFGLDNIVVSPTPEPGSFALLGTGLLGVGSFVRRRRLA